MAEPDVTLSGTLEGGVAAIGGETTGYNLNDVSIEIDMSEVGNADQLQGNSISVEGHFEVKEGVERGNYWIFKAHSVSSTYT